MKSIPLPVRVAAGLAATAVEQAMTLPAKLAGLPVTVASQALQVSMRVQQQVTELAIRGDEVLASLSPVEENPEWATFDEDFDDDDAADAAAGDRGHTRRSAFDRVADADLDSGFDTGVDTGVEQDLAGAAVEDDFRAGQAAGPGSGAPVDGADGFDDGDGERANGFPAADPWVAEQRAVTARAQAQELDLVAAENYDGLSLPQLRARLRRYSAEELAELLEYERAHGNRPSFVGMLTRRIATVRDTGD
jgi:hypothetical protein